MNLKSLVISSLLGLVISTPALATSKPDRCPSIDVIKYRGLLFATKNGPSTYGAAQFDRYGTSAPWIFLLKDIDANDAKEALKRGTDLLSTLSGTPEIETDDMGWVCEYQVNTNQKTYAFSFDEESDNFTNIIKFKK